MKKKKKIIFKILLSSLFVVLTIGAFLYILNQIKSKSDNTAILQTNIQAEFLRRNKITALNSEIKAIAPQREELETHFAKSSDVVPFLDTLQALSKTVGAPAEVSSLDLTKEGGGLELAMKSEGNFIATRKLLALLENSPYELDFDSVKIEKKILSDKESQLTAIPIWTGHFQLRLQSFNNK